MSENIYTYILFIIISKNKIYYNIFIFSSQECKSNMDAWWSFEYTGSHLERCTNNRNAIYCRSEIQYSIISK